MAMKLKFDNILWGLLLILAGGLALAQQQGWIATPSPQFWMVVFGALSVIFFVRYFFAGIRHWGWLFPACILAGLAAILYLSENGVQDAWLATIFFSAIIIPFLVAFLVNMHDNWWALIPAFIMLVLSLAALFEASLPGELIGALVMFSVAIPFTAVYFTNRQRTWALIPAFSTGMVGIIILLSMYTVRWIGAFVPIVIAIPFFYVYFQDHRRWWALIPGGIMGSIGINVWLTDPALGKFATSSFPNAILFLGWSATFYALWRQRLTYPTHWARIPAIIFGIVAIILVATNSFSDYGLVVVLIAGGLALIYFGLRPRKEDLAKKEN
jgi:hypothetical protein